jgi:hypothetical protein
MPTSLLIGNQSLTHLSRIGRCIAEHRPVSFESEVIRGEWWATDIGRCVTKHWPPIRPTHERYSPKYKRSTIYIGRALQDDRWRLSDVRSVFGATPIEKESLAMRSLARVCTVSVQLLLQRTTWPIRTDVGTTLPPSKSAWGLSESIGTYGGMPSVAKGKTLSYQSHVNPGRQNRQLF